MSVVHLLRGYERVNGDLVAQYGVPSALLATVARHITAEEGDSDIFGLYPLDTANALLIAKAIGVEMQVSRDVRRLDFFLEAEATDHATVQQQIAQARSG